MKGQFLKWRAKIKREGKSKKKEKGEKMKELKETIAIIEQIIDRVKIEDILFQIRRGVREKRKGKSAIGSNEKKIEGKKTKERIKMNKRKEER